MKKTVIASSEEFGDTVLAQIHSEVLEHCHFHVFAILVTAADSHLRSLGHINLKRLHLQIILIDCD